MFSMREYKDNSQTIHYRNTINEIYDLTDETIQKCKNDSDKQAYIKKKADQYAKHYAEWINKDRKLKLKYLSQ